MAHYYISNQNSLTAQLWPDQADMMAHVAILEEFVFQYVAKNPNALDFSEHKYSLDSDARILCKQAKKNGFVLKFEDAQVIAALKFIWILFGYGYYDQFIANVIEYAIEQLNVIYKNQPLPETFC